MQETPVNRALAAERLLAGFAFTLFLLLAALQILAPAQDSSAEDIRQELVLQARYVLGMETLFGRFAAIGEPGKKPVSEQISAAFDSLLAATTSPIERLRLAPLALALGDSERASTLLEEARTEVEEEPFLVFEDMLRAARGSDRVGAGNEWDAARLIEDHGWFGELAAAMVEGREQEMRQDAMRLTMLLIGALIAGLGFIFVGCIIASLAVLRFRSGKLHSGYRQQTKTLEVIVPEIATLEAANPETAHLQTASLETDELTTDTPSRASDHAAELRIPYLETVIVAILGLQVIGFAMALLMAGSGADQNGGRWPLLLSWFVLPILLWPLLRGIESKSFLAAIGWTRGRGFLIEIGSGLLAYLAAAPLLVLGFVFSALLARGSGQTPHHPILDWSQGAGWLDLALVASLAVIWAPIVEESLFRGVFFHYLRGRWSPFASALTVSVAFAALHPQGLAGLPFLICLALTLAFVREWRGSLIAPITVHMVHNGLVMGLLFSLL